MVLRIRSILLVLAALGGAACTAPEAGVASAPATEGSLGILHVERLEIDRSDLAPGLFEERSTVLGAAFARYRGIGPSGVAVLLGSESGAELDRCVFVGADDLLAPAGAEVELLDVGTLSVEPRVLAPREDVEPDPTPTARLAPRPFPDIASVLAGVVYAGDTLTPRGTVAEYAFRATGSDELAGFDTVVPSPSAPADVRVPSVADRATGLELAWSPEDMADLVEVEVRAGGDRLACVAVDDGAFRIPAASLATLAADADATLVVRRVRVTAVEVPGLEDAYARVGASRSFSVNIR